MTASERTGSAGARLIDGALRVGRVLVAVVSGYRGEALNLRAGNLTFITIMSLVPLAAVILSLVHALSGARIDPLLMRLFEDVLSPGGRTQSEATIRRFIAAASSRAGGGLSFAVVAVSAGLMLRHLDAALNEVWAVARKRPVLISIALYAGVLLIGPVLIAAALVGTEGVRRLLLWAELPYSAQAFMVGAVLVAGTFFTLLYKLAPHAPVAWRSALIGGFVAGGVWEAARHLYSTVAGLFFSANPIYGSLGIAPLFLVWIYVAWYIVLSGARLAYAVEHAAFQREFGELLLHPRARELIATRVAALVTEAALSGQPAPTVKALSAAISVPPQRVIEVVGTLTAKGLLTANRAGEVSLPEGADPQALTLADISAAVGGTAGLVGPFVPQHSSPFQSFASYFRIADETNVEKLKEISWVMLARHEEEKP